MTHDIEVGTRIRVVAWDFYGAKSGVVTHRWTPEYGDGEPVELYGVVIDNYPLGMAFLRHEIEPIEEETSGGHIETPEAGGGEIDTDGHPGGADNPGGV